MIQGIHHVAIICSDYSRSKAFYTETLKLKAVSEYYRKAQDSWKLDLELPDGSQIELFSFPDSPLRPNRPEAQGLRHLAFRVDSVEEYTHYLQTRGVAVEPIRIDELTDRKYTFFKDPDGLPLELYQR